MISRTRIAIAVAAACMITSPAFADRDKEERGDGRPYESKYDRDDRHDGRGRHSGRDQHAEDKGRHDDRDHDRRADRREWREKHGHKRGDDREARVNIPAGHLPPPGECRIWYPDRPAGQQPPPGDCGALSHRVPQGAVLVRG